MPSEEDRERATVYMEGLAEMQRDWTREPKPRSGKTHAAPGTGKGARPAAKGGAPKAGAPRNGRGAKKAAGSGQGGRGKS
jgi:hypothetical protein